MSRPGVNYDQIATDYDQRFTHLSSIGRLGALRQLAIAASAHRSRGPQRILEVGCGTGYWLSQLQASHSQLIGLDRSVGMLREAQRRHIPLALVLGLAERLPFPAQVMDLVYCVNAIHHLQDPQRFLGEAFRLLRQGGVLAVLGSDPHNRRDSWYVYDFFEGTFETDLSRFPAWETVEAWMLAAGFCQVTAESVERVSDPKVGSAILEDPFLQKSACSQLALLSDQAYADGLDRIRLALAEAETRGAQIIFPCELTIAMVTGFRP